MIKALLLSMTFAFGGEFTVMLSCDKLPEYIQVCDNNITENEEIIDAPVYELVNRIVWGYGDDNGSAFIGDIEIRYLSENVETLKSSTDENGDFAVAIIPDEEFKLYGYNHIEKRWTTHAEKYILRIGTTTGNLLWKEWKPSTSRWISLDFTSNRLLKPEAITNLVYPMNSFVGE